MKVPAPLTSGHLCCACHGTGADIAKTLARPMSDTGYVGCYSCNGNGLDPAEYLTWQTTKRQEREP